MTIEITPLREEHKELLPHLEHILALAHEIEPGSSPALVERVGHVHGFLTDHLLPHAELEERVLYPAVAEAAGASQMTATMSRDHVEVGALIDALGALHGRLEGGRITVPQAQELRRLLYGLHAVVKLHFAKEEEVYLPLLEARLTAAQADALVRALAQGGAAAH